MGTSGKKILVVDDSKTMRLLITELLSGAGYVVIEAVDGADGIEKLGAHRDTALVLCDLNMPRCGGLDMLTRIRANELGPVPVVMLTTESHFELVREARARGAVGWIVKPFNPPSLLAAVKQVAGDG